MGTPIANFPPSVQRRIRDQLAGPDPLEALPTEVLAKPTFECKVRPSTDEDKLNKTERAYLAILRADPNIKWIGIQNITLKLADDTRFTVDFSYVKEGRMFLVDVKGFQRDDALVKIKVAARQFTWATFVIVKKHTSGAFNSQEIKP